MSAPCGDHHTGDATCHHCTAIRLRGLLTTARPAVKESRDHWDRLLLAQEKAPRSNAPHMLPGHYIDTLRAEVKRLDDCLQAIDTELGLHSNGEAKP